MPKILSTSAEAAEYLWKNPGKCVTRKDGLRAWVDADGVLWSSGSGRNGAAIDSVNAPFTIPDEPGNEELPEDVVKTLSRGSFPDDVLFRTFTALWRATQKAIREQVKP